MWCACAEIPLQALCRVALLVGLAVTLEQILRPLLMQLGGGPQVADHIKTQLETCDGFTKFCDHSLALTLKE